MSDTQDTPDYRVGQVVYIVLKKSTNIVPALVVKQITEKTLDGDAIEYVLRVPTNTPGELKDVTLASLDAETFDSIETMGQVLTQRASRSIKRHLEFAQQKAAEYFKQAVAVPQRQNSVPSAAEAIPEVITMPDGSQARLVMKNPNIFGE
jgi:hypothetical protein